MSGQRSGWRRLRKAAVWGVAGLFGLVLMAYLALPLWVNRIAGSSPCSSLVGEPLSAPTQAWLDARLAGLRGKTLIDVHAHLAGRGIGSDCEVHGHMESRLHPGAWVRYQCYLSAGRVGPGDPDGAFGAHLFALRRALPVDVRMHVLGFDYSGGPGTWPDREATLFRVSDGFLYAQVASGGEGLVPAPSIHPDDPEAIARLEQAQAHGARLIKWLPAAQGIDPADARFDDYYAALVRLDLALLVHCGDEHAVPIPHAHGLGNPLRLRRALDAGVRIVVAHCASSGMGEDLDHPGAAPVPNHRLLLRLMDEPRYGQQLFADISTLTQWNHFRQGLADFLARADLHGRLLQGSDWPLPAIDVLYNLGALERAGFLDRDDLAPLREIYTSNPLLFDLALKRAVHHPETGQRFGDGVFLARPGLF
ncbi:MAG: amidohydrolase family protein [Planctomycetota bacterium]